MKEYLDFITAFAAISALFISIIAITRASKDNRKQILVGKVEEIYELTNLLFADYHTLYHINLVLDNYYNRNLYDTNQRKVFYEDYKYSLKQIKNKDMYEDLYSKIFRLNVLANSYLHQSLKQEIVSYTELFKSLLGFVFYQERIQQQISFKEGYPTNENMLIFIKKLELEFIKIINMSSEQTNQIDLINYQENEFKIKLGLK